MYSEDLKIRAIQLYVIFKSYRYVEKILSIGKSTLHRWVREQRIRNSEEIKNNKPEEITNNKKEDNINIKKEDNINKTSTNNIIQTDKIIPNNDMLVLTIKKYLDKDKFITIKIIQKKLFKKFNKTYSLTFIYTIIKKTLKYSYKKINNKLFNKSKRELKKQQNSFIKKIKNIDTNKVICIDETYMYSNYSNNYGWSKSGTQLINHKKSNPIKYSIIMAITNKKIINCTVSNKNVNSETFLDFMKILNDTYDNHYFLMDNVKFHKSKNITELFSTSTNKLLFIPPYSPQYNPIEEVFSQIKRHIKSCNRKNMICKLKKAIKSVKGEHLTNYYKHSFNNN